jgi:hypothetical protein
LIFRTVDRTVPRHAQGAFKHIAFYHSCSCWPQTGRIGECRSASAVGFPNI